MNRTSLIETLNKKVSEKLDAIKADTEPKYQIGQQCKDGLIVGFYYSTLGYSLSEGGTLEAVGWWYVVERNFREHGFTHEDDIELV